MVLDRIPLYVFPGFPPDTFLLPLRVGVCVEETYYTESRRSAIDKAEPAYRVLQSLLTAVPTVSPYTEHFCVRERGVEN